VFELQRARPQMRVRLLFNFKYSSFPCPLTRLACSDEFAEVKAVKLLRRGRRLQQVECVPRSVSLSSSLFLCSTVRAGPSMASLSMRTAVSLPPPPCRQGSFPGSSPNSSRPLSSAASTSSVSLVQLLVSLPFALISRLPSYRSYH
jgi:hypothetical protein